MNTSEDEKKKEITITDAGRFMGEIKKMVDSAVNDAMEKHIVPVKETLNQVLVEKEYTIRDVAQITGKHHKTIRNWLDSGDLQGYKLGKTWMIKHSKLEEFKNSRLEKDPYDKIFKRI